MNLRSITRSNIKRTLSFALGVVLSLHAHSESSSIEMGRVLQVVGKAFVGGQIAKKGAPVYEGSQLSTGADGYLYIQTIDNGFLILRPSTSANVPLYRVDSKSPEASRFKFDLKSGVARSISGTAVAPARSNFRFNTPVAAIGVLGTDFTVSTDAESSKISVSSGGVVVSGLGPGCTAESLGPCNVTTGQRLLANQAGLMLEVKRGIMTPQTVKDVTQSPDAVAPPRVDEPPKKASDAQLTENKLTAEKAAILQDARFASLNTPQAIIWGRWQALAEVPADIDLVSALGQGRVLGLSNYFASLKSNNAQWLMPQEAKVDFKLTDYRAQITQADSTSAHIAKLENGLLQVNFAKQSFNTSFDLVSNGTKTNLYATGGVGQDGSISNSSQFVTGSNMSVQGGLANPIGQPGQLAGYVFQSRLDASRIASGVTLWMR